MTEPEPSNPPVFSEVVLQYEHALRDQDPETWLNLTLNTLDQVAQSSRQGGLAERGVSAALRDHWYTRLATALTKVATSKEIPMTLEDLEQICRRKQNIVYVFNASGYHHMKHLISLLMYYQNGEGKLPADKVAIVLAFVGLDDLGPELMAIALRQPPEILLPLMLGWLNQRAVLTKLGEDNRARLLSSGHLLANATAENRHIEQIVNAWMYTSYASAKDKHKIKESFNYLLGDLCRNASILPGCKPYQCRERPRILVIHERFIKQSAMFRCYAPSIRTLNTRFEVIAIAEKEQIDDASDSIFDEVLTLPAGTKKIPAIVAQIEKLQPDLIYYPSLGMSHWTVMLAQLRLAPIQIMSHGHPATSMSSVIDYAHIAPLEGDPTNLHSEKLIIGPTYAGFSAHSDLPKTLPPLVPPSDREVRVAVNSKVMKLSSRLIEICKRLTLATRTPVRFSFFPGERGLFFDGLERALKAELPQAEIMPYINYDQFLAEMCRCDLALAAFPFGNTNSTVDTCLLGLPTIAHFGPESPAQSDKLVLEAAGFPTSLVCKTDEEYFSTALELINDKEKRANITEGLTREAVRSRLFEITGENAPDPTFGETLWNLFRKHESLQSTDKRLFYAYELADFPE